MKQLGMTGLTSLGGLLGSWMGMPWQAILAYTIVAVLCTTVVALAQIAVQFAPTVVPADSDDRAELWSRVLDRRAHRRQVRKR